MKNQLSIREAGELEEICQVFHDTKKELHYNKHIGKWAWTDKHEIVSDRFWAFDTALAAMEDAVEPYLNPQD